MIHRTVAGSAATDPPPAVTTTGVMRITAINSQAARRTSVPVERKAAVAAVQFTLLPLLRHHMDGAADQTDCRCFLTGADTITMFAIIIEPLLSLTPVWLFHISVTSGSPVGCTIRAKQNGLT